jgi:hypothetical protein
MKPLTVLSPHGAMSYSPLDAASFQAGLKRSPDFIGVDSGGLDLGALYLGAEREHAPWRWYARNVEVLCVGAREANVPLIIGNAGGNGTGKQLARTLESVKEIARRHRLKAQVATISADVDAGMLRAKVEQGKVHGLGIQSKLDAKTIERTTKTTAMMGPEPIMRALELGADIVLAGRCCDDAIYAALPLMRGADRGTALHLGKVLECGALCTSPSSLEHTVVGTIARDFFTVEPASDGFVCNATSVAAHGMYERDDPFIQPGPGGTLDLRETVYEQETPRRVKVSGSRFIPDSRYRVKLEGAAYLGHRAIDLLGIRDERMIASLDALIAAVKELMAARLRAVMGDTPFELFFHVYGRDAILGPLEPHRHVRPHEVALVVEVLAPDREAALEVCSFVGHQLLFLPYEGRTATAGSVAHLVATDPLDGGPAYEFSIDHLMELEDPLEIFRVELHSVG